MDDSETFSPPLQWWSDPHCSDDRTRNPKGRVQSDYSTPSNADLHCCGPFIMESLNANTVREEAKMAELAQRHEKRRVEILGVQEHRRLYADDQIVYRWIERCEFITSSAWQNEAQVVTVVWGWCWVLGCIMPFAGFTITPIGSLMQISMAAQQQQHSMMYGSQLPCSSGQLQGEACTRWRTLHVPRPHQVQW